MKKFKNKENSPINVDGKIRFLSRSVACESIVFVKNRNGIFVLINKRGKGCADMPFRWNLPSGYLDWNENGFECAIRETWEECGVDLDILMATKNAEFTREPFKIITEPSHNKKQNVTLSYGFKFTFDSFQLPMVSNQNCEKDEVEEILWCPILDTSEYDFAFHHDERIIDGLNYFGF